MAGQAGTVEPAAILAILKRCGRVNLQKDSSPLLPYIEEAVVIP